MVAKVLRVSIKGALPSGEEWSVNPVFAIGGDFGTDVTSAQANTIATAIAAVSVNASLTSAMSTSTTVTGARVEARTLGGTLEAVGEAVKGTPTPGTSTTPLPFQTAGVVSLRTAVAGARGRGRLYWPLTGGTITLATLRLNGPSVTTYLSGMKTYLSAILAAIDVTLDGVSLVVWSRASGSTANVTSLQMGDIADVQRRRRDQTVETYQALSFP